MAISILINILLRVTVEYVNKGKLSNTYSKMGKKLYIFYF